MTNANVNALTTNALTAALREQGLEVLHMTCRHVPALFTNIPDPAGAVRSCQDIQWLPLGKEVTVVREFSRIGTDAVVRFYPGDRITLQRAGSPSSPSVWTVARETIARKLERESGSWDGEYARPWGCKLRALGGVCLESSNDGAGNGSWSHSPTELWEFPDGSRLEVAYSDCAAV